MVFISLSNSFVLFQYSIQLIITASILRKSNDFESILCFIPNISSDILVEHSFLDLLNTDLRAQFCFSKESEREQDVSAKTFWQRHFDKKTRDVSANF